MSGPARNPDKLNTIGIVVVGICGAVLVYVTIVALQAFYMNDTSEIQNTADYGGEDTSAKALKASQLANIGPDGTYVDGTYHIAVDRAFDMVIAAAKGSDEMYVPLAGSSNCRTTLPIPGRGHTDPTPGAIKGCPGAATAPATAAGSGAGSAGAGSGSGTVEAAGSGAATGSTAATGSGSAGGHAP